MKRSWLVRSEGAPGDGILSTSQLQPEKDLRENGAMESIKESIRSTSALAVAQLMAEQMMQVARGDLVLVAYKGCSYVEVGVVKKTYHFADGKHMLNAEIIKRIERPNLPDEIRNKVLRKPRIIAEIEDLSILLDEAEPLSEVEYVIPVRENYSVRFHVPADFTKAEAVRLARIFENSFLCEKEENKHG